VSLPYPPDELIAHYRTMLVIRRFEEMVSDLFGKGAMPGTGHFCIGQEACAVGAIAALRPDDLVTSNHRGHGHMLAKGGPATKLMAELMGKVTGFCGGRSGSQHLCAIDLGFLGSNGITAGMIPVATGAALSQKLLGTGRVVMCFFGDGATGQGAFHEAINMGATWWLPIVYFCENNGYAMSMPVGEAFREPSVARRAAGVGLPTAVVDGMDYFAVREAAKEAVDRARKGGGPTLIEAVTYRFCGHSKSDGCEYRPDGEEEGWRLRDPLVLMSAALIEADVIDAAGDERVKAEAAEEIAAALDFARNSDEPDPATVADYLSARNES
jgi:TPP-dependent pyruvate/acetoin dehydrogenase alpha subunit